MKLKVFVKKRFKERSTWIALIPIIAGAVGLDISQEAATTLLSAIVIIAGAAGIITPDKPA